MFGGRKRIPRESFYGYLFAGAVVDGIGWFFGVPGLGDIYILGCRGMYYLNGYKTDKMAAATWADAAIEAVPGLSVLPSATAFAVWTYVINVAETSTVGAAVITIKGRAAPGTGETEPAAPDMPESTESRTLQQKGARRTGEAPEDTGQERGEPRDGSRAPTTLSDRNVPSRQKDPRETSGKQPYGHDARGIGIDGMRRPDGFPQKFRPQDTELPGQPIRTPEIGNDETGDGEIDYTHDDSPKGIDGIRDYRDVV